MYVVQRLPSQFFIFSLSYFGGHCHFQNRSLQCWSCHDSHCSHPERSGWKPMRHMCVWSNFTEQTKAFVFHLGWSLVQWLFLYAAFSLSMGSGYYLVCRFGDGTLLIIQQRSVSILKRHPSRQGKSLTPVLSSLREEMCYIHRHASRIKENTGSAAFRIHSH